MPNFQLVANVVSPRLAYRNTSRGTEIVYPMRQWMAEHNILLGVRLEIESRHPEFPLPNDRLLSLVDLPHFVGEASDQPAGQVASSLEAGYGESANPQLYQLAHIIDSFGRHRKEKARFTFEYQIEPVTLIYGGWTGNYSPSVKRVVLNITNLTDGGEQDASRRPGLGVLARASLA